MRFAALAFLALSFFCQTSFAASSVTTDNARVTLITSQDAVKVGGDISVGVLFEPREGWHIYWENPGDAGLATTLEWTLPDGAQATKTQWPLPEVIREQTLAVYGYEGTNLFPVTIHVPENYAGNTLPVKVKGEWLICNNICVPESAEMEMEIPLADEPEMTGDFTKFSGAKSALPEKLDTPLEFSATDKAIELTIPATLQPGGDSYFFVREQNHVLYAEDQTLSGNVLSIARNVDDARPDSLSGYLVTGGKSYDITAKSSAAAAPAAPAPAAKDSAPAAPGTNYFVLIAFAILGGLILNLMPCVLPVLSLKAIAIAKKSAHDRRIVVAQALAYTIGVLVSFALIAILLISLQQAGEQIGWGFQMQSPPFIGFLTVLLFLVGLNLSGMFEFPVLFGTVLADTREHSLRGSLLTGVLATAVATPCTAPFMATAVGAALGMPALSSFFIFLSIGLGLALPFLLIAIFPRLVALLPKPGAWMIAFRQLMAFPMYASVIWLLWVLTRQTGAHGLLIVLVTMLAITFIIWLRGRFHDASVFCRTAILLLMLGALAQGLVALSHISMEEMPDENRFSEARLSELHAKKIPVFVDATAAWCLTCQVNKGVAINTAATMQAFKDTNTQLLVADWTNRDPEITAFLKRFGYNGVPLYVYFPADGEPQVLPQILSESLVIDTVKGKKP